jgi:hypothetical protein
VPSYTLIAAQINQIDGASADGSRPTSTRGGATQADDSALSIVAM